MGGVDELLSDSFIMYILLWWFAEVAVVLVGAADDSVVSDCDFSRVVVVLLYCFTFSVVSFVVALIGVVGDDVDSDCNFGMNVTVLLCYFSFSFICQCWQIFYNVLIGFFLLSCSFWVIESCLWYNYSYIAETFGFFIFVHDVTVL